MGFPAGMSFGSALLVENVRKRRTGRRAKGDEEIIVDSLWERLGELILGVSKSKRMKGLVGIMGDGSRTSGNWNGRKPGL